MATQCHMRSVRYNELTITSLFHPATQNQCSIFFARLAWSRRGVNDQLMVADECNFFSLGAGLAEEAFASRQYRWASREELLAQIKSLSRQNQQRAPPELMQALPFEVPESDGWISQILRFFDGLAISQGTARGRRVMSSSFDTGTKGPHGQCNSAPSVMETYVGTAIFGEPSNSSPYWSPSSKTSISTPRAGNQMGNSINTTFGLNTMHSEGGLMSLASSAQATPPTFMISESFGHELTALKQVDHINTQHVSMPVSLQQMNSYQLDNADLIAPSHLVHDSQLHPSDFGLYLSSTDLVTTSPSLMDISQYAHPHSEGNTDDNYVLDYRLRQMQCAPHSLNEIVVEPSNFLPLETCQASSHLAFHSNDQRERWSYMVPGATEGQGMTEIFGQSEQNTHPVVSTGLPKIPFAEDLLADKRLEANIDQDMMQPEQGAALMIIENEGRCSKIRRRMSGMSSTNAGPFSNQKMSREKGGEVGVSSTLPSARQAVGSYVPYASGSAEAGKEVCSSLPLGSYGNYEAGSAENYEVGGSLTRQQAAGSYVSYESGSAEAYRVVGSSASQAEGSYVRYVSGSAETEKVVGSETRAGDEYRPAGDPYIPSYFMNTGVPQAAESNASFAQIDEKAQHHMFAERDRRRKHGHCIDTLRSLLPNVTKKDPKTTILESTIHYINKQKERICELEQDLAHQKSINATKGGEGVSFHVLKLQHSTSMQRSKQTMSSSNSATCHYTSPPSAEGTKPHFQRKSLIHNVPDGKANDTIIKIVNSLQAKNLCWSKIGCEFCKNNNTLLVNISANYKDGESHTSTYDEAQDMEHWWESLIQKID